MSIFGFDTHLNLGSTNKFFMPWLVPRNQKDTVYRSNWLARLFYGKRKRRAIQNSEINTELVAGILF